MADIAMMSNPMTAVGDIITGGASGVPSRLGAGSEGQNLRVGAGGVLEWANPAAGDIPVASILGDPSSFAGTADRDFRGAADLGNYTAVSGTAGTVSLVETSTAVSKYQLTSRGLLLQAGQTVLVSMKCDYTLPDARSMIIAMSGAPNLQAGDNHQIIMSLNDSDTTPTSGNYLQAFLDQDTTEYVVQANSSVSSAGFEYTLDSMHIPPLLLFRISRHTLTYRVWVSANLGATWNYVHGETPASAYNNVWIALRGASTGQVFAPAMLVPWIAEGSNDYYPW